MMLAMFIVFVVTTFFVFMLLEFFTQYTKISCVPRVNYEYA